MSEQLSVMYREVRQGAVWSTPEPPAETQPIVLATEWLMPPLITLLHRSFRAWGDASLSPGPIEPARVYVSPAGRLAFAFSPQVQPTAQSSIVGAGRDLAAWLILLDKWMETFVVVARARHVWSPVELASALPFVAPVYLPRLLLTFPPQNWARMGRALAEAAADGALKGADEARVSEQMRPPAITAETKRTWTERRVDHSAGGVAWRPLASADANAEASMRYEVALIATRSGTRWQLPKGTCEPGESAEETAVREVEEEVGLHTQVDRFLRTVEYWYWDTWQRTKAVLVQKHVDFYLQRVLSGELSDASIEVDATSWFTLAQARDILTFAGEREVVVDAIRYFEQPPT